MPLRTQSHQPAANPDPAESHRAELEELIGRTIDEAGGWLPFDRFMDLALYAPGLGYYVAGAQKFGAEGDFVTAPEISPLFARCLASPCRRVLGELGRGDVLELGAGSGAFAAELLTRLAAEGPLPDRYLILEPSPDLAERQRQTIARRAPALVERCDWLARLPERFSGVVLANEVLDAMPVHRFRINEAGAVEEIGVTRSETGFAEVCAAASPELEAAVDSLQRQGLATQPGYSSEVNLRLAPWTQAIASPLETGLILVIDYGYPRPEYYRAERSQGTLMCHSRHRAHDDPYRDVGLQDITAHVDFTALAEAAGDAGLALAGYTTQSNFLIGCGIDTVIAEAAGDDPMKLADLSAGAKQLLLPSRMGERFQVMGLSRGLPDTDGLSGFQVRDLRDRLALAETEAQRR
ncbi:MAG: SAM-dependent methyltransferase [Gammaproteobacteria bacterium]|jgi:SAM-dependent MidA family methyltransferase|nr:SAM-dependent methyltransferase [Gammaproteobacteria bacterium]